SYCTLFIAPSKTDKPSTAAIKSKLENPQDEIKAEGMRELITGLVQGEQHDRLLMPVIRYCVPAADKSVKKLVLLFLEVLGKCDSRGKLKEELILVCNGLRNDLMSPNEFVRGAALKLIGKIREAKVVEPLIEAIVKNLTHRHSYVRRNAVVCIFSLIRHFGLDFVPNAIEQTDQLLLMEGDASTRRAAFLLLLHYDTKRALLYIQQQQQQQQQNAPEAALVAMGEQMQLAVLELLRKVSSMKLQATPLLLRLVTSLLRVAPPAVAYEGAACILLLSPNAQRLRAAAAALLLLLLQQTENNIKLIVLDKLKECAAAAAAAAAAANKQNPLGDFVVDLMRGT
ncbi:Coatomer subunit beta, related, partial [Eimeria necatrix]